MASEQLKVVLEMLRNAPPIIGGQSVEKMRAAMEDMTTGAPLPDGTELQAVEANGVPCEWTSTPGVDPGRAILYLHGGGYVIGSIATHRGLVSRLTSATGSRALSVGYRLAPENPFPAAVDDATAAYRWLVSQGMEPSRVVIAGDSAGGGLALATLLALRDAGDALPAAGVCISPWVDLEGLGESMTRNADVDPIITKDGLMDMARMYLDGADPKSPLAAPLHGDLAGLPPLLIHVGSRETLLDDSTRLAEKAGLAGVDVTLEPWDEMIHVWHAFAPLLPESQQAIDRIGEYVRKIA